MHNNNNIRLGTRGSTLALWQAHHVASLLQSVAPHQTVQIIEITTTGDKIANIPLQQLGGQGAFAKEIETALQNNQIDIAVHSLKDLAIKNPPGLVLGAILEREQIHDCLISKHGESFSELKRNAVVGTSSYRRSAQLLTVRPDLKIIPIRGNVETRIKKVKEGNEYDATLLAYAGLARLNLLEKTSTTFDRAIVLPAPGQAALTVQCRENSPESELLSKIDHLPTRLATEAERQFLAGLGGGCSMPVAALGYIQHNILKLEGRVIALSGNPVINVSAEIKLSGNTNEDIEKSFELGKQCAEKALTLGASKILDNLP